MEKICINCKWFLEDKRFCKWISGYTEKAFNCKNWKNDKIGNEENEEVKKINDFSR